MQSYFNNWNQLINEQLTGININQNSAKAKLIFRLPNWPIFQGVNRLFVLSFENNTGRPSYKRYYLPQVEIKDYNVMLGRRNFFDQLVKTILRTYDKIWKIATG